MPAPAFTFNEHRSIIQCLTQTTSKIKGKVFASRADGQLSHCHVPSAVSQSLALDIGLTVQYMDRDGNGCQVSFSILLYCRKCVHTVHPPAALLG